ncbi:MAG TPA: cupin domain-containing protein [Bryobacteraceae bacterium]|nr:cupin domain-containing protein [Bryobacteraceae bacterium]
MNLYEWNRIPVEQVNPRFARQVIHTENMTVARLHLAKGCSVQEHKHINEQVSMVETGSLRFILDGEVVVVRAGGVLRIPPNAIHSAEAIEDTYVVDLFSPRREDWIRGDDAYLRK